MSDLNRRKFHQLTAAAFGGLVAGSLTGCPSESATPPDQTGQTENPEPAATETPAAKETPATDENVSLLMQEPHVCRGLNMCKNQGLSKENACAGQGTCASVAVHECAGENACKGQGGCGENPGENACKGLGSCRIPLMDDAWTAARKNFEAAMKAAEKEVGPAPEKTS